MCNCIAKIAERVRKEKRACECSFERFNHQSSELCFTPRRIDGNPAKHRRYIHVNWKFCPFCGETIRPPKDKP